jgi:hypothetical protein
MAEPLIGTATLGEVAVSTNAQRLPQDLSLPSVEYLQHGGEMSPVKEEAKRLIDELPDTATWDDVMYELYVKMKIARAVAAAEAGDVVPHEEAKRRILAE